MVAEQDSRGDMRRRLGSDTAVEMQREGSATSLSSWVLTGEAPYGPGYALTSASAQTSLICHKPPKMQKKEVQRKCKKTNRIV